MKNRIKIPNEKTIADYLVVLSMILCSGTVIFNIKYNSVFIPFAAIISFFAFLYKGTFGYSTKRNIAVLAIVIGIIFLNTIIHFSQNVAINGIFQILLYIAIGFFAVASMRFDTYKRVFVNIMVVLALCSILSFLCIKIGILHARSELINGRYYQLVLFDVVGWGSGESYSIFDRICGFFSEPGMYQIPLNISLLYMVDDIVVKKKIHKKEIAKLFSILAALALTKSSTGYIVAGLIVVAYIFKKSKKLASKNFVQIFAVIVVIIIFAINNAGVILDKFTNTNLSYSIRLNDNISGIKMLLSRPISGYGHGGDLYRSVTSSYGIVNMSNGLLNMLIFFGLPIGIIIAICLINNINKQSWNLGKTYIALIFLFEMSTEGCEFFPIMIVFWLSFSYKRNREINLLSKSTKHQKAMPNGR